MSSQPKDIIDCLQILTDILNEKTAKPNKISNYRFDEFPTKKKNKKRIKTQKNPEEIHINLTRDKVRDENTEEYSSQSNNEDYSDIVNDDFQNERNEFEEEEEEFQSYESQTFSFINNNSSSTEIFSKNKMIEEQQKGKSSPLKNFINIKSNAKTFIQFSYFRKWRRAFHAKQIQQSIINKMKKYKKEEEKKEEEIYKPLYDCYHPREYRKLTLSEQRNASKRLSKPRNSAIKKSNSNSPQTPKTEEEKKNQIKRNMIRQIEHEREEKNQEKPLSHKKIMKTVERLAKPKPQQEKEIASPKRTVSYKEQHQMCLRLLGTRKEIIEKEEEIKDQKINKRILPTKQEQMETSIRLSERKKVSSPIRPLKITSKLTPLAQKEIWERLSNPKNSTSKAKRNYDDIIEEKKKKVVKKKVHKNRKKRSKKHAKKKDNGNIQLTNTNQNPESTIITSNHSIILPAISPANLNLQAPSPLTLNTPTPQKKVRFNKQNNEKQNNENQNEKLLSQMMNEALGETNAIEEDSPSESRYRRKSKNEIYDRNEDEIKQNQVENPYLSKYKKKVFSSPKVEYDLIQDDYQMKDINESKQNPKKEEQSENTTINQQKINIRSEEEEINIKIEEEEEKMEDKNSVKSNNEVQSEKQMQTKEEEKNSPKVPEPKSSGSDESNQGFNIVEEEEEVNQVDFQLFDVEEEDNFENDSLDPLFSYNNSFNLKSSKDNHGLSTQIEIETLKEIDHIEQNNNDFYEEEDDDDLSGIDISKSEIESPINGLVSTSDIELNLLTKSEESVHDSS